MFHYNHLTIFIILIDYVNISLNVIYCEFKCIIYFNIYFFTHISLESAKWQELSLLTGFDMDYIKPTELFFFLLISQVIYVLY